MPWVWLFLAGLCEVVWAVGLKLSDGFTRPLTTTWTILVMLLSFILLSQAMRSLPLGTSYAIWTGIGAVGTAIWGIIHFGEQRDLWRLLCIGLIVAGIIGLKVVSRD